jgi:hypothetical protein
MDGRCHANPVKSNWICLENEFPFGLLGFEQGTLDSTSDAGLLKGKDLAS